MLWFLVALLLGKLVATSLTMAIGGSGGVFAPSLFIGAMLGAAYADVAGTLIPGTVGQAGGYALVGMGAVFAATSRAPITAVVIIFELTGDYHLILPLMLAVVVATTLAALLSNDSIYTLKLRRRGIDLTRRRKHVRPDLTVGEVACPIHQTLQADDDLMTMIDRLADDPDAAAIPGVAVTDDHDRYLGIVTAAELDKAAADGRTTVTASDLALAVSPVQAEAPINAILGQLLRSGSGLPVSSSDGAIIGWITQQGVLLAYHDQPLAADAPRCHKRPPAVRRDPI